MTEEDDSFSILNFLSDPLQCLISLAIDHYIQLPFHFSCTVRLNIVEVSVAGELEVLFFFIDEFASGAAVKKFGFTELFYPLPTIVIGTGHVNFVNKQDEVFEILVSVLIET